MEPLDTFMHNNGRIVFRSLQPQDNSTDGWVYDDLSLTDEEALGEDEDEDECEDEEGSNDCIMED